MRSWGYHQASPASYSFFTWYLDLRGVLGILLRLVDTVYWRSPFQIYLRFQCNNRNIATEGAFNVIRPGDLRTVILSHSCGHPFAICDQEQGNYLAVGHKP